MSEQATIGAALQAGGSSPAAALAQVEGEERERAAGEQEREEGLDPEARARRDRALAEIRKLGDPVLRTRALPVERFDRALRAEARRMGEIMADALGVGLAATQVGILHRLFVYRVDPDEEVQALVNPLIVAASEERETGEEGCLSIPYVHVAVERHRQVTVRAQDLKGRELELEAEGLQARVIQHELDHLDGVLILDRISQEARREAMRLMREARAAAARR
ncbi:MAG TPA: peptide deformylase [Solirubrobacteraceae bacterium]|nr:peptide deformylase [Solirubrobacteraceae bacterium]